MLDVYRSYYKLTGEPFRLGPDHRFSLHHTSYATAKAYLVYAIDQGEGFIAITGGPGTGKSTLISEILAGLDRHNISVATLNSTQVESRDLLHLVASSFGLQLEKVDKSDLLLDLEAFLVARTRSGHRAILIVDEAQGLSPSALEELRLLANLQYQYKLLLQIVLVGQERLLELIRSPGMEHLQQRLVAAASLEPLSFDETIDYIEHRLRRVGWQGDPAIDESALRLVFRYSGGIPRRINLIANRLFLYGGMEEKHRFNGDDARSVIDGLIEEFLLPPEPLLAEDAIKPPPATPGQKPKARSLPRETGRPGGAAKAATPEPAPKPGAAPPPADKPPQADDEPTERRDAAPQPEKRQRRQADFKLDRDAMPGSRAQSRGAPVREKKAHAPARGHKARQPAATHRAPQPVRQRDPSAANQVLDEVEDEESGSKGLLVFALLLAGAGAGYFLYNKSIDLNGIYKVVSDTAGVALHAPQEPQVPEVADQRMAPSGSVPEPPASDQTSPVPDQYATADSPDEIRLADKGQIIREADNEPTTGANAPGAAADTTLAAGQAAPSPESVATAADEVPADKTVPPAPPAAPEPPAAVTENPVATPSAPPPAKGNADAGVRAASEASEPTEASAGAPEPEAADSEQQRAALQAEVAAEQAQVERAAPKAAPPKPVAPKAAAKPAPPAVARIASNTTSEPVAPPIDAQRARLKEAAEKRFSEQVARIQSAGEAAPVAATASTATIPAPGARSTATPDITLSQAEPPAAAPPPKPLPITPTDIKTTLLEGRWSSSGKPATLLPSESTFCDNRGDRIWCVSVPQNVKTQYGLALYKVETTLTGFAAVGQFEMSYRTMVKLVGEGASGDWQITDYSMSCTLTDANQVSCLDDKGVTRRYVRSGPGRS
jgi:type II secretory pathway predicted ATPase ExeA